VKPIDLLKSLGNVKDSYVISSEEFRQGKQHTQVKRLSTKRIWLIAAAIVLSLMLVGCAIVYILSLQDMAFGTRTQEYYDGSSQEITLLSIQGIKGTPGYQATKEWYEWLETYDTDLTVYHSEEAFSEDFGDDYYAYNLYSHEMKDKLDEICAKYGLELLGKMYDDPDPEAACKTLQIPGICRALHAASVSGSSYILPNSSKLYLVQISSSLFFISREYKLYSQYASPKSSEKASSEWYTTKSVS
jgi:hypothetical protein